MTPYDVNGQPKGNLPLSPALNRDHSQEIDIVARTGSPLRSSAPSTSNALALLLLAKRSDL